MSISIKTTLEAGVRGSFRRRFKNTYSLSVPTRYELVSQNMFAANNDESDNNVPFPMFNTQPARETLSNSVAVGGLAVAKTIHGWTSIAAF